MKLAEALILRSDLQKRIAILKDRLIRNAKVQEGDNPAENPQSLLNELSKNLNELEIIINKINRTNSNTIIDNELCLSDLINKRELLGKKTKILRDLVEAATIQFDRYSQKEVKFYSTVNVSELQKEIDKISKEYRETDTKLQGMNWNIDLIE
ncbi:DIP1984 family protein [Clostridium ihumii]|uniref:DIP1984 family protein n=1 Tax=Clostridium ihumii TaxID=1470356 RepID=UPI00058BCBB0|nr:DIP1984 family protein [Clostridium ihumii]